MASQNHLEGAVPEMKKLTLSRPFIQKFGVYFSAELMSAVLPFLLLPVLTRFLTPQDYGTVAMFQVLVLFTSSFIGLSTYGAVNRQYFDREHINFPEYIGNCLYILFGSSLIIFVVFYLFRDLLFQFTSFPVSWLWSVLVVSFCKYIFMLAVILWQVRMMALQYGIYQVTMTGTNLALSILFVVWLGMDWRGRIVAQVIAFALFALVGWYYLMRDKWVQWRFNSDHMKHALKYALPLIPHALGGWVIAMSDRIFITRMIGLADTGVYTVGYQIGMITGFIGVAFNRIWSPWFLEKIKNSDESMDLRIVKTSYGYFAAIMFFVFLMSVCAPYFVRIFVGKEFGGSTIYIFWIALGYAFDAMYRVQVQYIFHLQKTYILTYITMFAAVLNLILNYFFIKANGAVGAAQATSICFALTFVITWAVSSRIHPMPYNLFKLSGNK